MRGSFALQLFSKMPVEAAVGAHLATRFPSLFSGLAANGCVPVEALVSANFAKIAADPALLILRRADANTVVAWCKSRDKREATTREVVCHWELPVDLQCSLASKAYSEDSASSLMGYEMFCDEALAVLAVRSNLRSKLNFLTFRAGHLTDAVVRPLLSSVLAQDPNEIQAAVALSRRAHLALGFLDECPRSVAAVAALELDPVDQARLLDVIDSLLSTKKEHDKTSAINALVRLLEQTCCTKEVSRAGFELAEKHGVSYVLARAGVPTTESPLVAGTKIADLDKGLLTTVLARHPGKHNPARALAVREVLRTRDDVDEPLIGALDSMPLALLRQFTTPELAPALLRLSNSTRHQLPYEVREVVKDANDNASSQEELRKEHNARTVPKRTMSSYSWGLNNVPAPKFYDWALDTSQKVPSTATATGDKSISEVHRTLYNDLDAPVLGNLARRELGDGSTQLSLQRYEMLVSLLERAAATTSFSAQLRAAKALVKD